MSEKEEEGEERICQAKKWVVLGGGPEALVDRGFQNLIQVFGNCQSCSLLRCDCGGGSDRNGLERLGRSLALENGLQEGKVPGWDLGFFQGPRENTSGNQTHPNRWWLFAACKGYKEERSKGVT